MAISIRVRSQLARLARVNVAGPLFTLLAESYGFAAGEAYHFAEKQAGPTMAIPLRRGD